MPLSLPGRAPYAPGKVVVDLIQRHRDTGLPRPVSAESLQRVGVSESLAPRTVQALRMLELIDGSGMPTEAFERLKHGSDEEFRRTLTGHLDSVYEPVLDVLGPVAAADDAAVETAFRGFEPHGQRQRMASLFTALYEASGARVGGSGSRAAPGRARAATRKPPKSLVRVDTGAVSIAGRDTEERTAVPRSQTGPAVDPLILAIMAKLPPSGSAWSEAERARFIRVLEGALDLIYTEGMN